MANPQSWPMDQIPTQQEADYILNSPAFDATSPDFVDIIVAVFQAYAEGRLTASDD